MNKLLPILFLSICCANTQTFCMLGDTEETTTFSASSSTQALPAQNAGQPDVSRELQKLRAEIKQVKDDRNAANRLDSRAYVVHGARINKNDEFLSKHDDDFRQRDERIERLEAQVAQLSAAASQKQAPAAAQEQTTAAFRAPDSVVIIETMLRDAREERETEKEARDKERQEVKSYSCN